MNGFYRCEWIKKVINNRAGLFGRLTKVLQLMPFTLKESEKLLQSNGIYLDRKQIAELYMAIGGIPYYLSLATKGESVAQIVNNIFFSKNATLKDEFYGLFQSLFDEYENHKKIIYALYDKKSGLTKNEILKQTDITSGGFVAKLFQELEYSGFISYIKPFGNKKTKGSYILIDELVLFYLNWLDLKSSSVIDGDDNYWLKMRTSAKWKTWSALAFEIMCLKHVKNIKKALGIGAVLTNSSSWKFKSKKGSSQEGAQIDLVIDRADRCINLCEIKFCDTFYDVTKKYQSDLERKKRSFLLNTKTKKNIFITLISPYGLKENIHSNKSIDSQVTLDALFE